MSALPLPPGTSMNGVAIPRVGSTTTGGQPRIPRKPTDPSNPPLSPIIPSQSAGAGTDSGGSSWSSFNSGQPQSFAGFQNFAQTGGFSPTDLANIRSRAVSPVRAVYANAQQNVNRQRALQGGYSPGFGVLQSRMAREQGQQTSDAAIGAESNIAEMVQQGKLAGLQGMASTEGTTSGGGSSGGGGGGDGTGDGTMETALVPEKKKGFWGKLGSGLKKIGQIGLSIAAPAFLGGLAAPLTTGLTGAGQKIGTSIAGGLNLPKPKAPV